MGETTHDGYAGFDEIELKIKNREKKKKKKIYTWGIGNAMWVQSNKIIIALVLVIVKHTQQAVRGESKNIDFEMSCYLLLGTSAKPAL
jgi:hypothetical protein